jgi:hypothetical protein
VLSIRPRGPRQDLANGDDEHSVAAHFRIADTGASLNQKKFSKEKNDLRPPSNNQKPLIEIFVTSTSGGSSPIATFAEVTIDYRDQVSEVFIRSCLRLGKIYL